MIRTREEEEKFLKARAASIGGSEIGILTGENHYQTPYELWDRKVNGTKTTPTIAMRRGSFIESFIAQLYAEEMGCDLYMSEDVVIKHPRYSWAHTTPDNIVVLSDGKHRVVEHKNSVGYAVQNMWKDGPPDMYVTQLMWNTGIYIDYVEQYNKLFGDDIAVDEESHLCALLDNDLKIFPVQFDREKFELLLELAEDFWNRHVIPEEPPPVNDLNEWKQRYSVAVPKKQRDLSDFYSDALTVAQDYLAELTQNPIEAIVKLEDKQKEVEQQILDATADLQQEAKDIGGMIAALKDDVKIYLEDAEELTYDGTVYATLKNNKNKFKFNADSFKAENAELYRKYLVEEPGARSFRIKRNLFK
jgi:putative phage-type endonuclease